SIDVRSPDRHHAREQLADLRERLVTASRLDGSRALLERLAQRIDALEVRRHPRGTRLGEDVVNLASILEQIRRVGRGLERACDITVYGAREPEHRQEAE